MKTVVILISSVFPKESAYAGQPTDFVQKIEGDSKLHTIRANLNYWLGKEILINSGEAELSLRTWSGAPYRSEQIEIKRIPRINIQMLNFIEEDPEYVKIDNQRVPLSILAKNDGLTVEQIKDWFKGYDLNETMALINFSDTNCY